MKFQPTQILKSYFHVFHYAPLISLSSRISKLASFSFRIEWTTKPKGCQRLISPKNSTYAKLHFREFIQRRANLFFRHFSDGKIESTKQPFFENFFEIWHLGWRELCWHFLSSRSSLIFTSYLYVPGNDILHMGSGFRTLIFKKIIKIENCISELI